MCHVHVACGVWCWSAGAPAFGEAVEVAEVNCVGFVVGQHCLPPSSLWGLCMCIWVGVCVLVVRRVGVLGWLSGGVRSGLAEPVARIGRVLWPPGTSPFLNTKKEGGRKGSPSFLDTHTHGRTNVQLLRPVSWEQKRFGFCLEKFRTYHLLSRKNVLRSSARDFFIARRSAWSSTSSKR